jgi:hypothetical protein
MNENLVITSSCIIRNNTVILNGKTVFSHQGDPREFSEALYRDLNPSYPKFYKMDTLSRLGFLTAELLLSGKNPEGKHRSERIAMVLANSSSSLDTDRKHQKTISSQDEYFPSPSVFVYTLPNVVMGELCIRHRIHGEGCFFVMERFNPGFISEYSRLLISGDVADGCIAGWIECDGNVYESGFFLIEKTRMGEEGITIFSAGNIRSIFYQENHGTADIET